MSAYSVWTSSWAWVADFTVAVPGDPREQADAAGDFVELIHTDRAGPTVSKPLRLIQLERHVYPGKAQGVALPHNNPTLTQQTLHGIVEIKLLLRGFIERLAKADGRGPRDPSQKRPFVERRRTPCTSTWQPPAPSAAARRWWSPARTTFGEKTTPPTAVSAVAG